jgi:FKBP-type peptidyl-prolyl cis-trans isomerase
MTLLKGTALLLALALASCQSTGSPGGSLPTLPQMEIGSMPNTAWTDDHVQVNIMSGGLQIEIFEIGAGSLLEKGDEVVVHYRGWLAGSSTTFDSSFQRGEAFPFQLGVDPVIKGWEMGLIGLTVGTRARLHIPWSMGYGEQGAPPTIPAATDLVFDVQILGLN